MARAGSTRGEVATGTPVVGDKITYHRNSDGEPRTATFSTVLTSTKSITHVDTADKMENWGNTSPTVAGSASISTGLTTIESTLVEVRNAAGYTISDYTKAYSGANILIADGTGTTGVSLTTAVEIDWWAGGV